ncbi:uncharacterized protein PFLUO_LOCUS7885 [Penicillium psychrofluorescens]|uniref:uncharacterized protein n=1 Tax=Penicillium psychrofluorescens TaxID=3158075 RepID=UPI003CCDE28B
MKTFVTLAAFAAGTNALVGRSNSCCFHLTASGGVSGSIGQLNDGQTRVGDNSLSPAQFCLDSSNGTITDSKGRGCVITSETTQFQCDAGAAPTQGFSINSQGELVFQGSDNFIACETGERNGRNIYTTDSADITMCKPVNLHADSCSSSGAGASSSSVVTPVYSTIPVSSAPATESTPAVSPSGYPGSVSSVPASSVPVSSVPATESTPAASPSGYPGSGSSVPASSVSVPVTESTTTTESTATESTPAVSPSGYPGSVSSVPASSVSVPVTESTATESTPAVTPSGYPGSVSSVPASSVSVPVTESTTTTESTATESTPAVTPSGYPGSVSSVPASSVSVPVTESTTVTESTVTESTPAVSPSGYPGSGSGTSVSAPAGSGSPPLAGSPYTVLTTVTVTDCSCSATPGVPAPGSGSSVPGSQPSGPASGSPAPATTPIVSSQPGGPASMSASSPSVFTSVPVSASSVYPSVPASGSSVPAGSASVAPSATGSSSGSCPTDLSGDYEFPHLIIPVDSSSPDTAPGTSYNGTLTSSISSLFNFDIPSSDAGKTCSLVFLFPEKQDLETSSFSFSGDGQIDFAQLSSPASSSTSYSNMPSVSQDFGTTTVSPGNSYVISTFSCPAGQTVGYEMKNAGSTDLNFFEDYNPSPLGLYITVC